MKSLFALLTGFGLVIGLAVMTSPATGPAAGEQITPQDTLVNDEIVVASLDPTGLPIDSEIISRLASTGGEQRTVLDPTSTANVTYLNQRGRPVVTANGIEVEVGGPEPQMILTRALVDKPMPLAMHAQYRLNDQIVDPDQMLGASGGTRIKYTVTNIDAKDQKIRYTDAAGKPQSKKLPVFAPLVGTLTTVVPADWDLTDTGTAAVTTNEQGDTVLAWSLVLYPPLGNYTQTVAFDAVVRNGSVPQTLLTAAAVRTSQDPAAEFSDELLTNSVSANQELASGVDQLNEQTLALAQGASQLSTGITEAATGADAASAGVSDLLVPGTEGVAVGSAALALGAVSLAEGTEGLAVGITELAEATEVLAEAMPELADASTALTKGAEELADAVGSPNDPPLPEPIKPLPTPTTIPTKPNGDPVFPTPSPASTDTVTLETLVTTSVALSEAVRNNLVTLNNNLLRMSQELTQATDDLAKAKLSSGGAYVRLCQPDPTVSGCDELKASQENLDQALAKILMPAPSPTQAASGVLPDLIKESLRAYLTTESAQGLYLALTQVKTGVDELSLALRSGSNKPGKQGLVEGLEDLSAGIEAAAEGAEALDEGTQALDEGAEVVADGGQDLAVGSEELAVAASEVAFGTVEVSAALTELAVGLNDAASGGDALAAGSAELQSQGTEELYAEIVASSDDPAQASAYLEASNKRADSALPYGAPEGAVGNAAYVMTMAAVTPSDTNPWLLLAIGLVVLAAISGAILKRLQDG
jgi:putative membrane protein